MARHVDGLYNPKGRIKKGPTPFGTEPSTSDFTRLLPLSQHVSVVH